MKDHDIYDRVLRFACRVVEMNNALAGDRRVNRNALNQLVDSSTSIGANLEEARAGQSKADFHAKLRIALKEARESHFWLRLLHDSKSITSTRIAPLVKESNEIVAILTTIAKKTNPKVHNHRIRNSSFEIRNSKFNRRRSSLRSPCRTAENQHATSTLSE